MAVLEDSLLIFRSSGTTFSCILMRKLSRGNKHSNSLIITCIKSNPSLLISITRAGMKNYPSGRGETMADRLQRRNGGRKSSKTNFSCQLQETGNMVSVWLSWQGNGCFPWSTAAPSQLSQALVRPINHLVSEDMPRVCVCTAMYSAKVLKRKERKNRL